MNLFDKKILNHCDIENTSDTLVLSNVNGYDFTLTYRRGVGETWAVRMRVSAMVQGRNVNLFSADCTEESKEFWLAAVLKEFENAEAFR